MTTFLSILIALDSLMLILVILIQKPKGGGIDSTFGGLGANQMLGAAKSVDFVERLTWILAAILIILSIITAIYVGSVGLEAPTDIPLKSAG
ncbi:MAG: preprotein translocase subunit SecG [Saprospiraceae bacterium]|jgi:preprotein translocase subunit SecG|nr:preprotein translocase subunit SecG [Saprospiraceae bacterium]